MATHSSILAWRIHVDRRAWWATVHAATELDTTGATRHTHMTVCHIHTVQRVAVGTKWHKAKRGGGRECEAGCSVLKGGQGRSSWEADIWSKTLGDKGVSRGAPQEKRLLSTTAGSGWRWGGNVRVPCGRKSRKHTLKSSLSIHQPDPN